MGTIFVRENGATDELGYFLICSGYLVAVDRVLLVHHNRFDKWVPPGGHIAPGETFAETAVREFYEETGLRVEVVSSQPEIHQQDANASPLPVPFYVDIEREGFSKPAIVQFFFVRRTKHSRSSLTAQVEEVYDAQWFTREALDGIPTFEQVRSLCRYALTHHPDAESKR